jgi:hypothetical protein
MSKDISGSNHNRQSYAVADFTKIGSGDLITAAIGQANIVTHVNLEGSGNTMSLVVGRANIIIGGGFSI